MSKVVFSQSQWRHSHSLGRLYCSQNFLDDQDIEAHHLGMSEHYQNPWNPVSEDMVIEALQMILDTRNYPLYVCCNLGRHRTGTVIGCLRKLQVRWTVAQ